jgi:hypothetical protein
MKPISSAKNATSPSGAGHGTDRHLNQDDGEAVVREKHKECQCNTLMNYTAMDVGRIGSAFGNRVWHAECAATTEELGRVSWRGLQSLQFVQRRTK